MGCLSPAPIPNICHDLMVRRPRIEISSLLNIKGRMENHLLLAKKKKAEGSSSVWGSKCLPGAPVTQTHRSDLIGRECLVVFTECNETHLIKANLYGLDKQDFASFYIRCRNTSDRHMVH